MTTEPSRSVLPVGGGDEVVVYTWAARPGTARAPLVIVHGYAEHAERHAALAEAAAAQGHQVYALDLPGHGRCAGERALVRSYAPLVDAVSALVDKAAAESGTRPLLFGHSMGGAVALAYALEHPSKIGKLVLSAPYLIDGQPRPAWVTALAGPVAALAPRLPVAKLDEDALARDPAVGAAYVADPLVHSGPVPAATGHTLVSMGGRLISSADRLDVPTLVIHGEDDRVASPEGSRMLAEAAGPVARLVTLPGAYHEMHNEPDETGVPQRFTSEVLGFLSGDDDGRPAGGAPAA